MPERINVALLSETANVGLPALRLVAHAINEQLDLHFSPAWKIYANVVAGEFATTPSNFIKIIIRDDIGEAAASGFHSDDNGAPYALVQYNQEWSIVASHELLEILCDKYGNKMIPGIMDNEECLILAEICDPVEGGGYLQSGVPVSDFCLPEFYGTDKTLSRYSFLGLVTQPLTVAVNGYISYLVKSTNMWKQIFNENGTLHTVTLGSNAEIMNGFSCLKNALDAASSS